MGSTREFGKGARFTGGREGRDEERGTVARATVDSTLAVIPAEAFRRLTRKFPKASAHIVQGAFAPFSRSQIPPSDCSGLTSRFCSGIKSHLDPILEGHLFNGSYLPRAHVGR